MMATPEQLANRETWRAALLSGAYRQGQQCLRGDDYEGGFVYCCLGVAADVVVNGTWLDDGRYQAEGYSSGIDLDAEQFNALFGFTPEDMGVEDMVPADDPDDPFDAQSLFITANDDDDLNFDQIAAMIPTQDAATSS